MSSLNDAKKLAKYNFDLNSKSTAQALKDAKALAKYNNTLEQDNTKLQYNYNQALAQEDRSWQERMANSAHQREIADLKAAGLNPVLSVTGGNGAATPGGSATSVSKPNVDMSLPKAVMDMAMAQLNSATSLQIAATQANAQLQSTAMNNTAMLKATDATNAVNRYISEGTWDNNINVKEATSGDSISGQVRNLGSNFAKMFYGTSGGKKLIDTTQDRKNQAYNNAMNEYLKLSMEQATTNSGTKAYRRNKRKLRKLEKRIDRYSRS